MYAISTRTKISPAIQQLLCALPTCCTHIDAASIGSCCRKVLTSAHVRSGDVPAPRLPVPPFTRETAIQKVQAAEDAWNTRDPERVSLAYTKDTEWRNRDVFLNGREQVVKFLRQKWLKEHDYRLKKTLWAFTDNRIAVRFEYEWRDDKGQWWRSHGNENWEFDEHGYMKHRYASINDQAIAEHERKLLWPRG